MKDAKALGQRLRDARQAQDMNLDEAERLTRIRAKFLDAIERGDYTGMTPVQARGFLRNYARVLGLDLELLLTELDAQRSRPRRRWLPWRRRRPDDAAPILSPLRRSQTLNRVVPQQQATPPPPPRRRRSMARPLRGVLILMLVVGLLGVGGLGLVALVDELDDSGDPQVQTGSETPDRTPDTPPADVTTPTTGDTPPIPPGDGDGDAPAMADTLPADTPTPEPLDLTGSEIKVTITVTQRTWLQVTTDGDVQQEGLAEPGDTAIFTGASVRIRASNAAGLRLVVNNQPRGPLGGRGQLYDETFTVEGTPPPAGAVPPGAGTSDNGSASPAPATLQFTPTLDSGVPTALVDASNLSPTVMLTATPTSIPASATPAPTLTGTFARLPTYTLTPSVTPTPRPTEPPSPTPTVTPSPTITLSPTPTLTTTPSGTPSLTPFLPPRNTSTPTPTKRW